MSTPALAVALTSEESSGSPTPRGFGEPQPLLRLQIYYRAPANAARGQPLFLQLKGALALAQWRRLRGLSAAPALVVALMCVLRLSDFPAPLGDAQMSKGVRSCSCVPASHRSQSATRMLGASSSLSLSLSSAGATSVTWSRGYVQNIAQKT